MHLRLIAHRKLLATGAGAVTMLAIGIGVLPLSGADATPKPSPSHVAKTVEHFTISTISPKHATAIAHGAFTGGGKDVQLGQKDVLSLGGGTVTLRHPNKQSHFSAHVNPRTCYATVTVTGKYTVGHGTGTFAGITGHGRYVGRGQDILKRTANGTCNQRSEPKAEVFTVKANGPVTLPTR